MNVKRVLLDMDGVLVDFVTAALLANGVHDVKSVYANWPGNEWNIDKVIGCSAGQFWANIDQTRHFWEGLQEYSYAAELIMVARSAEDWAICTTPSRHPNSAYGKVRWLQREFGVNFRKYYLCAGSKAQLADPVTLLIDDNDKNVADFRAAGGNAVLWPQLWNCGDPSPSAKIEALQLIRDYLK